MIHSPRDEIGSAKYYPQGSCLNSGFRRSRFRIRFRRFRLRLGSRETSTAAAAAIEVSAADSHTFAEQYHNRPFESSQAYLRTIARLQQCDNLVSCPPAGAHQC